MPVADGWDCSLELTSHGQFPVGPAELCAGYSDRVYTNVCKGDSGGPLVYRQTDEDRYTLVGITFRGMSTGSQCVDSLHYAVFTSVEFIYSWVMETTACIRPGEDFTGMFVHGPNKNFTKNPTNLIMDLLSLN